MAEGRRSIRHTRYRLRYDGISALEVEAQETRLKTAQALFQADDSDCDDIAIFVLSKYNETRRKAARNLEPIQRTNLRVNQLGEDYCWNNLRFRKMHIPALMIAWDVPRYIVLPNRSKFDGEECFLLMLRKFGKGIYTVDLEHEFGRDNTQLGRAIKAMINLMYRKHKHLLVDNLPFFEPRYEEFNTAIRRKIQHRYPREPLSNAAKKTGNYINTF
jgi:hypothetical protein